MELAFYCAPLFTIFFSALFLTLVIIRRFFLRQTITHSVKQTKERESLGEEKIRKGNDKLISSFLSFSSSFNLRRMSHSNHHNGIAVIEWFWLVLLWVWTTCKATQIKYSHYYLSVSFKKKIIANNKNCFCRECAFFVCVRSNYI